MTDLVTIDGVGAFILLVLPGAISLQVYRMILPTKPTGWSESIPQALFYSLLNFAALFPFVRFLLRGENLQGHPISYWATLVLCLIAAPIAWPLAYRELLAWRWLRTRIQLPYPTAWDFQFARRRKMFVLATLNDGTLIGGYYGDHSYATSYPHDGDIYLETAIGVSASGEFEDPIEESGGILLRRDQYQLLELFEVPEQEDTDGQE